MAEGVTRTAVPLITPIFPGVITPAPFAKTAVRPAELPAGTDPGSAANEVIDGAESEFEPGGTVPDEPPHPKRPLKLRATNNVQCTCALLDFTTLVPMLLE